MRIFAEIIKRDDDKRLVFGYASTEALDSQGERVTKDAIEKALPEYMRFANIREMHQPSAVGVAKSAEIDDKGLYIQVKVVDDAAWEKVKEGVYKGFSIGGKSVQKADGVITEMLLKEISLVDRPANPEAVIDVWKAEGPAPEQAAAVTELAKLFDAGAIKPTELLELAKKAQADKDLIVAALPDGTFKIVKAEDLRAALRAFPGAKDAAIAKAHIISRAKELGLEAKLPAIWKGDDIAKGMYAVSWLANLLDAVAAIQCDARWEKDMEGDDSAVPAALAEWLKQGGTILQAMVSEETSEQAASVIAAAEPAGDVAKKDVTGKGIADPALLAVVSEILEPTPASLAKAEFTAEIAKRDEQLAMQKTVIETLEKRLKKLEDEPLPPKGATRVIDKSGDNGGAAVTDVDPVRKADGTVDDAATEMKKVHATGGRRVFSTT